ncbi:hypothetical protein GCM10027294_46350 [Marinactinospora endophytica]
MAKTARLGRRGPGIARAALRSPHHAATVRRGRAVADVPDPWPPGRPLRHGAHARAVARRRARDATPIRPAGLCHSRTGVRTSRTPESDR